MKLGALSCYALVIDKYIATLSRHTVTSLVQHPVSRSLCLFLLLVIMSINDYWKLHSYLAALVQYPKLVIGNLGTYNAISWASRHKHWNTVAEINLRECQSLGGNACHTHAYICITGLNFTKWTDFVYRIMNSPHAFDHCITRQKKKTPHCAVY